MSALTSSMAPSWSGVSWNGKASSSSRCQTVSGPKACPLRRHPRRVQPDQLGGDLLDRLARLALGVLPVGAAELGQRRRLAADVAGELVEGVGGHEQPVRRLVPPRRRVLDDQVVALPAVDRAADHLDVAADAVLLVHDEVAGLQLHQVDGVAPAGRHLGRVPHVRAALAGQVVLGEQRQARRPGKAKPDSRLPWVTWVSPASGARGDVGHQPDAEVGLGELVGGALRGPGPGEGDDDPPALAATSCAPARRRAGTSPEKRSTVVASRVTCSSSSSAGSVNDAGRPPRQAAACGRRSRPRRGPGRTTPPGRSAPARPRRRSTTTRRGTPRRCAPGRRRGCAPAPGRRPARACRGRPGR